VELLNEIQVGVLQRLRTTVTCEVGKDDKPPTHAHTLTLVVQCPRATAEELAGLLSEGAAVEIVAGTRQHRLPIKADD
jgi:hypothetical protein